MPIFSFDDPSMIFNLKFYHRFELISDPQFFLALFIVYNTVNDTVVSTIIASYLVKVVKSQLLNSNTLQIILILIKVQQRGEEGADVETFSIRNWSFTKYFIIVKETHNIQFTK